VRSTSIAWLDGGDFKNGVCIRGYWGQAGRHRSLRNDQGLRCRHVVHNEQNSNRSQSREAEEGCCDAPRMADQAGQASDLHC
jgi:hypothetical protein